MGIGIACPGSIPCIAGMDGLAGAGRRRVVSDFLPLMPGMSDMPGIPGIDAGFFSGCFVFCCAPSDPIATYDS
ncbi:MAG TPA: hypothetical protein VKP00_14155, partial [Gemmatimonadaceae bacterium]|nr:hypothetical protein [Gemmatimonadaceae bacterium]